MISHAYAAFGLLLSLVLLSCVFAQAATVEEVMEKHLEAIGGKHAIDSIASLKIEAALDIGGMTGSGTTWFKAPDKFRADISLPVMSTSQGCFGDDCWMADPRGLTVDLGHELKRMMVTQRVVQRSDYALPEKFDGELTLQTENAMLANDTSGLRYYVVEVNPVGGVPAKVWIDKRTFLMRQISMKTDMGTLITEFFDYKGVAGVQFPHRYVERTDAALVSATGNVTSIEINPELSDTLFVAPGQRHESSDWNLSADSLVIPCDFWRNHLYVEATIGGEGPHSLIFDTGAGGLALNSKIVEGLDLEVIGQLEARGVGGAEESDLYQIESLEISGLQLDSITASAIDFSGIEATGTHKIDGIIGYTLLSRFITVIDYGRNEIILYPRSQHDRNWGHQCDLTVDFRLPYIDATINDSIVGTFRLDTGSISTLDLNSPFVKKYNLVDTASGDYIELMAVGVGGTSSGLVGQLDELEICSFEQDSIWAGFTLSDRGIFSGASTAGNIGAGILKRFRITLDYASGSVYFQPTADYEYISHARNMAGITLERTNGAVTVAHVLTGHAASDVLRKGDILLEVDNVSTEGRSLSEIERLLVGGRRTVEIVYERDGERESAAFRLESYF